MVGKDITEREQEIERLTRKVAYLQSVERSFLSLLAAIRALESAAVVAAMALDPEDTMDNPDPYQPAKGMAFIGSVSQKTERRR